jgi:Tol biopolymer transport system component
MPDQNVTSVFEMHVNPRTAEAVGVPKRVATWRGFAPSRLNATADGRQIAFVEGQVQADVYVGTLKPKQRTLSSAVRLTQDEWDEFPMAWTADSRSVLFTSFRNGQWQILQQALGAHLARRLSVGDRDARAPRVTPDGRSLLFFTRPKGEAWNSPEPVSLMRLPLSGGEPSLVLRAAGYGPVSCAHSPATRCAIGQRQSPTRFAFYALDPQGGRGRELATMVVQPEHSPNWALSPDGSRIAVAISSQTAGFIRLFDVNRGGARDIPVWGWNGFQSLDWASDGNSLFVSSGSSSSADLLRIDLDGKVDVIRHQSGALPTWGIPSPDGRHLAFVEWTSATNACVIERS